MRLADTTLIALVEVACLASLCLGIRIGENVQPEVNLDPFVNLTVDRIVPRLKAGTDHISYLQSLCAHCNSLECDRTVAEARLRLGRTS